MEAPKTPPKGKDFWDDIRETVRDGAREIRNLGDDLARQGRLRMDIFQTERRLKSAHGALGELVYKLLSEGKPIDPAETAVAELTARIRYYSDELSRLQQDLQKGPESNE
ncbi:hypothetical protein EHM69_02795 [candidate division KSB1 bacterium]|nr:MAG: hypothetical protein EHM69_02795 [candidate division KSB1 bacterium]